MCRTRRLFSFFSVFPLLCAGATGFAHADTAGWFDDFYAVRIPVSVTALRAGRQVVEIDAAAVTEWVNAAAEFPFDVQAFAYDNVRLIEAGGDGREIDGGFRYELGAELIVNGGFQDVADGTPVGWTLTTTEGFRVRTEPDGTNRVLAVEGADRNACLQGIPTADHAWYRFSYMAKGEVNPAPHIIPRGVGGWAPVDRSAFDPVVTFKDWRRTPCFFYTGDKSEWDADRLLVRIERFTGEVDQVSLRRCRMAFVADIPRPGTQPYYLYYAPYEGPLPAPPSRRIELLPALSAAVTPAGKAEWLDDDLARTLATTEAGVLWWAPTTHKVKVDEPAPATSGREIRAACARNEAEAVQLVFRASMPVRVVSVSVDLTGPGGRELPSACFDIRCGRYVPIHKPSEYMNGGRVMKASRFAFTGRLPDPLTPFEPVQLDAGAPPLPIWIDITVPAGAAAGSHTGTVTVATDSGNIRVPLRLEVWDFALPERPTCRTAFGISQYAHTFLFPYHKVETREDKYVLSHAYIEAALRYKISPKAPATSFHWFSDRPVDWATGEQVIRGYEQELPWAMDALHSTSLLIAHWSGPVLGSTETDENGVKEAQRLDKIAEFLGEKGWLDRAFVWIDEPRPNAYAMIHKWVAHLRARPHAAGLKIFPLIYNGEAYEGLGGVADMMACWDGEYPFSTFSPLEARRDPPRFEAWGYYTRNCTLWIDTPGINHRFWAPKMWALGGRGLAIWSILQWWETAGSPHQHRNPWVDPMVTWGNGALSFFYPPSPLGKELPEKDMTIVPSLRLLLTRDGIEDFEYGAILTRLVAEARGKGVPTAEAEDALAGLRRPFPSPVHWNLCQTYWQNARRRTARAIERLSRALSAR